jgi:hypothetical protein
MRRTGPATFTPACVLWSWWTAGASWWTVVVRDAVAPGAIGS